MKSVIHGARRRGFSLLLAGLLLLSCLPLTAYSEEAGDMEEAEETEETARPDSPGGVGETTVENAAEGIDEGIEDAAEGDNFPGAFDGTESTGEITTYAGGIDGYALGNPGGVDRDGDTVYTWEGLLDWLRDHVRSGGTAVFGDDITISSWNGYLPYDLPDGDVLTLETGAYSLIVECSLYVQANYLVIGDGTQNAVVELRDGGSLDYNKTLSIVATGPGGCALSVRDGGALYGYEYNLFLKAEGEGGVALRMDTPLTDSASHFLNIEATGAGSKGIVSTEPVELQFCIVKGGAASVDAPSVILDTCVVSPDPENVSSRINRKITDYYAVHVVDQMPVGTDTDAYRQLGFARLEAEGVAPVINQAIYCELTPRGVDTSAPGSREFALAPVWPWSEFDVLTGAYPMRMTVSFYNAAQIPHFSKYEYDTFYTTPIIQTLTLWYEYTGDMDDLTLWRSDDEGKSWYEYQDANMQYIDSYIILNFIEGESLTDPAILLFETKDYGDSMGLRISWDQNVVPVDGDRNGGDRSPGGEVPLPTDPPPKGTTPGLAGSNGSSGSNSSSSSNGSGGNQLNPWFPQSGDTPDEPGIRQTNAEAVPAPEPVLSAIAEPVHQLPEQYTTVLTGAQFSALIKADTPHLLLMGEDGLRLWFPRSEALALGAVDSFAMRLYMLASDRISVGFWFSGAAFTGAFDEPFVVGVPWERGEASADDEAGAAVPCTYSEADGFLLLTLHKPGIYTITAVGGAAVTVAAPVADEPASTAVPLPEPGNAGGSVLPATFAGIGALGGAGAFAGFKLHKRRVKRPV